MKFRSLICGLCVILYTSTAVGELNTLQYVSHDGLGQGRLDIDGSRGEVIDSGLQPIGVDLSEATNYTLLDGQGGDMWNGGDQFTYLYDRNKVIEDFTATVRVVAQTQSVEGRWGKTGITAQANLSGLGQNATADVYTGTGSQADPPASGAGHNPVPVRMGGRTGIDGTGGFENPISNASGEIPNNVFAESEALILNPKTNVSWLRLNTQQRRIPSCPVTHSTTMDSRASGRFPNRRATSHVPQKQMVKDGSLASITVLKVHFNWMTLPTQMVCMALLSITTRLRTMEDGNSSRWEEVSSVGSKHWERCPTSPT